MAEFNHGQWIKKYKMAIHEKNEKVALKDLLHTTKVDDKKADKVDIKRGAENDLAIEKDKDGNDVYAGGLREDKVKLVKPFQPGDMWSNDFDYVGMLKYGASLEIPEGGTTYMSGTTDPKYIKMLNDLHASFTDVNYHTEGADLGNAIDWLEDAKSIEDLEKADEFLNMFKEACAKTLKEIERR